jgi:outer membrane protein W
MKKAKILGLIFLFIFEITISKAQDIIPEKPLTVENLGFYAGGHASTNGLGLQVGYILSGRITFRSGFETLNINYNFDFDENDISYDADLKYKTGAVYVLADYYYTHRLYFSVGAGINSFNPKINGEAASDMQYGDISIPAEQVGDFHFSVEPSLKVAPYLGAGFRQFLGKKEKVVYNFETGFYILGAPKFNIEATGLLSPTADPAHNQVEYLENQFSAYKIYPVLKFNLAFKLF